MDYTENPQVEPKNASTCGKMAQGKGKKGLPCDKSPQGEAKKGLPCEFWDFGIKGRISIFEDMKRVIFILLGLMTALTAGAQAVMLNPNPGKVSEKEVVLSVYPLDTTAAAMFLVDRTEVAISVDKPVELRLEKPIILDISAITYHRVKILQDSGWDELAHYELTVPEADRVDNIKVVTYNLVNGRVVKTKLSKKNIQKKKLEDKLVSYSFTAPEVRKGHRGLVPTRKR